MAILPHADRPPLGALGELLGGRDLAPLLLAGEGSVGDEEAESLGGLQVLGHLVEGHGVAQGTDRNATGW
eukprot:6169917-Alexandrium_andersonii.AAC.1